MATDGDNVKASGRPRTRTAWLFFGCGVLGIIAVVVMGAIVVMATNVEPGQMTKWAMSIDGFIAAFGVVTAYRCLARLGVLYGQWSAHRNIVS